jgi:3-hydroxy-2-methylpyridine-4,5-dicarboxylate 4-decarboxylase
MSRSMHSIMPGAFTRGIVGVMVLTTFIVLAATSMSFGQAYTLTPKTAEEAIDQVVWANRILANEGIFDYLGHVSMRNPENPKTYFMARGIAPSTVTKKDILELDQEGNVLTKNPLGRPYGERVIHSAIYRDRPDVNSVVHAHPQAAVILSISKVPFQIIFHPASVFYEGVPLFKDYDFSPKGGGMLIKMMHEGDRISKTLGKAKGMLMWAHGCNVVGKSVPNACQDVIAMRDNIVMLLAARQFGEVTALPPDLAKIASEILSGPERAWGAWVMSVMKNMPDMK